MRKSYRSLAALLLSTFFSIAAFTQTIITGTVRNSINKDVIPAASITVKGGRAGTYSDEKGNFKLVTNQTPPITLVVSSAGGYETLEIEVRNASDNLQVELKPGASLGVEVVVSASRVPERILESPVSIERISSANIRKSPAVNYYDILRN